MSLGLMPPLIRLLAPGALGAHEIPICPPDASITDSSFNLRFFSHYRSNFIFIYKGLAIINQSKGFFCNREPVEHLFHHAAAAGAGFDVSDAVSLKILFAVSAVPDMDILYVTFANLAGSNVPAVKLSAF